MEPVDSVHHKTTTPKPQITSVIRQLTIIIMKFLSIIFLAAVASAAAVQPVEVRDVEAENASLEAAKGKGPVISGAPGKSINCGGMYLSIKVISCMLSYTQARTLAPALTKSTKSSLLRRRLMATFSAARLLVRSSLPHFALIYHLTPR